MRSVDEHRSSAPDSVSCFIITVSDTRTLDTDISGQMMRSMLRQRGFVVADYILIKDDYDHIRQLLKKASEDPTIDAILLSGGTGISPRDTTFEAVRSLLDKELPGFGEIFRHLSFTEDIGTAAILSRAIAGSVGDSVVFSVPGSTRAVKLAMEQIILPELKHVVREIRKK